nr:dihydrodipicolinate synthase family protein [uncultured Agathobaculum sp.]
MNKFAHVYPAMVTPMNEDGSFNFTAAKKHADWMISEGIDGLGILMAAGEYQSMSLEEHKAYVREMVPYVKDRVSVIVGCSRERPEDAVELMENAREAGASAAMVLPSFYYHPTQHEIYEHYKYINDHSGLDIMVYNNGNVTTGITTETMRELYKLEHVKIVKDASMMIDVMTDYIFAGEEAEDDIGVLCGCDYLLYQAYATGAIGWISMTANILPKLSMQFHKAMLEEKDFEKGLMLYKKLYPVVNMTERFDRPTQAVKYILEEVYGFEEGICRRPRQGLTEEDKKLVLEWSNIRALSKE